MPGLRKKKLNDAWSVAWTDEAPVDTAAHIGFVETQISSGDEFSKSSFNTHPGDHEHLDFIVPGVLAQGSGLQSA